MAHNTPLISTIVVGLVLAFAFGTLAQRFRVSPLVGYLLAGVVVGPFTPGYVADQPLANELAEIGVILLMFGVGLHFSLKDLLSVRAIAVPGALVQIVAATLMGILVCHEMGHYVAARRHGIDVSLPYFIPVPFIGGIGTMGAVIKMRSPISSRDALADVGASGPLVGLAVAIPMLVIGLLASPVMVVPPDPPSACDVYAQDCESGFKCTAEGPPPQF